MNEKQFAIIVAGGSGSRINSPIPKQFLEISGKPVVMHTIEAFYNYRASIKIILVLPERDIPQWKVLCDQYRFNIPLILTKGGESRFESVRNGLKKLGTDGLVAIHDGARPLVSRNIISKSFETAAKYGNAITAVSLKDSIRKMENDGSTAMDRAAFKLVQTPQTFKVNIIKAAYANATASADFTDDAIVVERAGQIIHLVEGSYNNIKITTPEDLPIAEALLSHSANGKKSNKKIRHA